MLPFRLVYHERYDLHLGRARLSFQEISLAERPPAARRASPLPEDFVEPEPATDEDVRLVHDAEYVAKLRNGTLSYQDILRLEIPYSRQMVEAFWLAAGGIHHWRRAWRWRTASGSTSAAASTMRSRAMARASAPSTISRSQSAGCRRRRIKRAMVVDVRCAPRQRHRGGLRRRSIGVHALHPPVQQLSRARSRFRAWISTWRTASATPSICTVWAMDTARRWPCSSPNLLIYVAGADPYLEDQLGGLSLTLRA